MDAPATIEHRAGGAGAAAGIEHLVRPGALLDLFGSSHRVLALIDGRVLATDLTSDRIFLVQDEDGSIQLPRMSALVSMLDLGTAKPIVTADAEPSPGARMRHVVGMLDAASVPNGEKAIWIYLAANWSPALEARFGPHDEPWKIRRWRTALRRAMRASDPRQS